MSLFVFSSDGSGGDACCECHGEHRDGLQVCSLTHPSPHLSQGTAQHRTIAVSQQPSI